MPDAASRPAAPPAPPYIAAGDGVRLAVRVSARAHATALAGVLTDADGHAWLGVRLHAPPVDGAANAALIAFVAKAVGLRKADVTLHSGRASRQKILHLAGDAPRLCAALATWIGA